MLQGGDLIRHFEVTTLGGTRFTYADAWQRRNLVLVVLPRPDSDARKNYVSNLTTRMPQFSDQNTECVMTEDPVPRGPHPGSIVADRRGEVIDIRTAREVTDLPSAEELLEWIEYVETRCPECEGEAR
jgi:hypothetical protein